MSREILFRGQRIDTKEWVEGGIAFGGETFERATYITNPEVNETKTVHWFNQVIPETVGQWTGLKDGKGQKIFEGDIVIIPGAKQSMQVVYQAPSFVMKIKKNHKTWSEFILSSDKNQFQEVIGNIHAEADHV